MRVARGFGNFQESYFIRGFLLSSDNVAYNGLYSLLPRQYISAELFERVEVLRGASAFLNGASPDGDGIGGSINLLPKRAPNEPLSRVTAGFASGSQGYLAADVARRFGADQGTGIRVNVARRDGGTAVDREKVDLSVAAVGLDWHDSRARLSADIGYQDHQLDRTRTNVTLDSAVTGAPKAPASDRNWAQPWSHSNEQDTFGTVRGEYDVSDRVTAYAAYGMRRNDEANSLAGLTVRDGASGAATTYRFDNADKDKIDTGEIGLRAKLRTGPVGHAFVVSASMFKSDRENAYGMSSTAAANLLQTNLYNPVDGPRPPLTLLGNDLGNPATTRTSRLTSFAVGDTMSFLDDTLMVMAGVRHQKLDNRNFAYNSGALTSRYDESKASPIAGVVYRLRKDVSLYANYIEALSPGETAPATAVNRGEVLSPYVSKQQEIGVKYDSGRLGATAALFTTKRPRSLVDANGVFDSEGEDRYRGLELTVYGTAARGLRVLGGLTLLDAEQRSTGVAATDGNKVIGVPTAQGTLGVEWDVPGVSGLALDARAIAMRSVYANASNTLRVPDWARFDLGARYLTEVAGRLVTLRLRVDNVADRDHWSSAGGYPGNGYLVLGSPRTVTLSASIDL